MVVAVVVVVDESPAECVVSCARVVVGAVGAFCGETAFKGFAHRFGQERPGDGIGRRESVPVKCGDAWRRPVVGDEDTELFVGEASRRGGVRSGGVGVCCEESASGTSEGFGAGRFSQGRGCGKHRHCLSFHSINLRLPYKCEAIWRSDTLVTAAISGTASAPHAFRGDASSRNEKSGNLASYLLAGGVLFRPLAIRYDVFPGHRGYDTPDSQKAPSAKRCIKTSGCRTVPVAPPTGQKAPSTKRCIKTRDGRWLRGWSRTVRKHRAPKGALRPIRQGKLGEDTRASESTERQKVH